MLQQNLQLVDDLGNLNSSILTQIVQESQLRNSKGKYTIVSLIGPHNSGKSTLLNRVFGIPNVESTRGIWVSHDSEKELIVLDVEGSTNNGQLELSQKEPSSTSFQNEFKVVKKIMEMNVNIDSKDALKRLLFVFRDFNSEEENFNLIKERTLKEVYGIWDTIEKEESYSNTRPDGIFTIEFSKISHLVKKPTEFEADMKQIRERFVNSNEQKQYLPSDHIYRWNIPIEGLDLYSTIIWKAISNNQEIKIDELKQEAQKKKCLEIRIISLELVQMQINELQKLSKVELMKNFSQVAREIINDTLNRFGQASKQYHDRFSDFEYQQLEDDLKKTFHPIFLSQVDRLKEKNTEQAFKQVNWIKNFPMNKTASNMKEKFEELKEDLQLQMLNEMKDNLPLFKYKDEWEIQRLADEFVSGLNNILPSKDDLELAIILREQECPTRQLIDRLIRESLKDISIDYWRNFQAEFDKIIQSMEENIRKQISTKSINEVYFIKDFEVAKAKLFEYLLQEIKRKSDNLPNLISSMYKNYFIKEEGGADRKWKQLSDEEIKTIQERTYKNVEDIIHEFAQLKLSIPINSQSEIQESHEVKYPVLLEDSVINQLKEKLKSDSEAEYNQIIQQKRKCNIF